MELVGAHIDRENNRFGDVEYWMDAQDSINHGLSKYTHLISTRQMLARNGVFGDNIDAAKREFRKPDGWIEYRGRERRRGDHRHQHHGCGTDDAR